MLQEINNKRGISTMELAVVLALIAIMATMTIPYLGSWLKHYRVVGAARQITSTLQEARIKAVSNNREWRVKFDQSNGTFWLEQGDLVSGSGTWTQLGGVLALPRGVIFTDSAGSNATGQFSIQFNPSGTAANNSVYIKGEGGERFRATTLQITGRVRIYVWNGSSWAAT